MNGTRRLPWAIWGFSVVLLGLAAGLGVRNGSLSEDPIFTSTVIVMMVGYVTVGAFVTSRVPGNPVGWLLLATGTAFLISIATAEYARYALDTNPGSLPLAEVAVWLTDWTSLVAIGAVMLIVALFPNGAAASPRWRWLPPAIVADITIGIVASWLQAGPVDVNGAGVDPSNPTGVEALTPLLGPVLTIVGLGGIALGISAVASLVLRYRAAHGEERQQIRWLAYVGFLAVALLIATMVASIGLGLEEQESTPFTDALFFGFFIMFGIGIPAAAAIAVLRYRLWDLDVILKKTIVAAVLVGLLTIVSLLVLLVVSAIVVGPLSDSPGVALVAGVGVGALTWPLLRLSRRIADRLVYGGRATPYEVLTEFSDRMAESYATDDVLPRMASILGAGTGAKTVTIWLIVGSELRPATTWSERGADGPGTVVPVPSASLEDLTGDVFVVRHQGEQLGAITVSMHANDPMNPAKEKLIRDLAGQAGLVLRNVRLIEELRASRRRLVAAQDEARRRLERNIHDGAQQQLVALQVKQRLVEGMIERDPAKALDLMSQLQADTAGALDTLRDLARGIYPPLLADQGLSAALESQARKSTVPISVEAAGVARYPQDVEAAVYFCALEALNNLAKYAEASRATVSLSQRDGTLTFAVSDDGVGFDTARTSDGTGLQGMADRIDAIGGSLEVRSVPGEGTTILGRVPVEG